MPEFSPLSYHTFRKPKRLRSGKKVYRWYYYWLDQDGKQHQKACIGCRNRSEAESYIRDLAPPPSPNPTPAAVKAPAPVPAPAKRATIGDICKDMYIPGSAHVSRRHQLGKSTELETMVDARRFICRIIDLWAGLEPGALGVDLVMPYLFTVDRSGKWKNRFLEVLGELQFVVVACYKMP